MNLASLIFNDYFTNLKEIKVDIDSFEAAYKRLQAIIEGKEQLYELQKSIFLRIFKAERAIVMATNNNYIKNRVAIRYAKFLAEKLNVDEAIKICEILGVNIKRDSIALVRFDDYLKFSPKSDEYKIFYLNLKEGFVELNERKLIRFVEEVMKSRLLIFHEQENDERAKEFAERLLAMIPKTTVKISYEKPPCIEAIINQLYEHENLSHYSRWVLAVYLINIGMDIDEIVKMYQNLPDFNEKITRYHLEFIKKKNYKMPSCEKMLIYGLRKENCPCNKGLIDNPLKFGKINRKVKKTEK